VLPDCGPVGGRVDLPGAATATAGLLARTPAIIPGVFTLDAPVVTDRLLLRAFRPGDLDDLHAVQSHPDVVRYLYHGVRTREEVCVKLAERTAMTRLAEDHDTLLLAIEPAGSGRVVGDVMLQLASAAHRQGEIGYVLHPRAQGRGYAREAAAAVLEIAFGPANLHRVFARADARNVRSVALLRRLGLRPEAHLVENEFVKGEWTDEVVLAILAREWTARRS